MATVTPESVKDFMANAYAFKKTGAFGAKRTTSPVGGGAPKQATVVASNWWTLMAALPIVAYPWFELASASFNDNAAIRMPAEELGMFVGLAAFLAIAATTAHYFTQFKNDPMLGKTMKSSLMGLRTFIPALLLGMALPWAYEATRRTDIPGGAIASEALELGGSVLAVAAVVGLTVGGFYAFLDWQKGKSFGNDVGGKQKETPLFMGLKQASLIAVLGGLAEGIISLAQLCSTQYEENPFIEAGIESSVILGGLVLFAPLALQGVEQIGKAIRENKSSVTIN